MSTEKVLGEHERIAVIVISDKAGGRGGGRDVGRISVTATTFT